MRINSYNIKTGNGSGKLKLLLLYTFLVLVILLFISCTPKSGNSNRDGSKDNPGDSKNSMDDGKDSPGDGKDSPGDDQSKNNAGNDRAEAGELIEITRNGMTAAINSTTGMVEQVRNDKGTVNLDAIIIDVGYNESYQFGQLGYSSFEGLATWELPMVWPKMNKIAEYELKGISETEDGFITEIACDTLTVEYHYKMLEDALKLHAVLKTFREDNQLINGVGFLVKGLKDYNKSGTTVEFPGSTPAGRISLSKYPKYRAVASDYAASVIQINQDNNYLNILFVNEQEKWTSASYSDENDRPCTLFLAAVEGYLKAGEEMTVGDFYIQPVGSDEDPYLCVQDFWGDLGYHVPEDGISDGPVYSGHPAGTMDTGFSNKLTLKEYAGQLADIAAMGFKNVWLLPIFHHTGDNVYEPIDQGKIDVRYGGEEEAAYFIEKAHELGLRVLFDMVPHGPRPVYPFAKQHDDWVSKDRSGNNQIEWECVSFDYNNPEYYEYTVDLTAYYAEKLGLDGSRIDCSMGGLSNWQPVEGFRPSSSGFAGGINIVRATREGFIKAGVNPILLPENFHPNPAFAKYSDMFYDMPLYRTIHNLNYSDITETEFVQKLEQWLEAEHKTSVRGQVKLRFLGNHDTVTWTFDAARPQSVYGTDKAKALWSILSLIDGVPYIYQGDEDPASYNLHGENLRQFFTDLLAARKAYLPAEYGISYIYTDTPIFAFTRFSEDNSDSRLVLVNLSSSANSYDINEENPNVLYKDGSYRMDGTAIILEPYTTLIIRN